MGLVPFFTHFFAFLRFSLLLLKDKGKQQQCTAEMGNFTPTPAPRARLPDNCRAITLTAGGILKRKKTSLLGGGTLEGILRDNLGEGNWESKIAARQ